MNGFGMDHVITRADVDLSTGVITVFDYELYPAFLVDQGSGRVERLATQVMHTRDALVREALIKLGWTPPTEDGEAKET